MIHYAPTIVVSVLYGFLAWDRTDYLGHFAAGYGGTLAALILMMVARHDKPWEIVLATRAPKGRNL